MGTIRVGTAGWTDRSLVDAGWYPPEVRTPEQRLRCYAERFDFVEVNSTFYGLPSERNARAWVERTPDDFTFAVKAFSLLTRHHTVAATLPPDLRPGGATGSVRPTDLPPRHVDEVWSRFLGALEPLAAAGRLGPLLFQFPPWFRPSRASADYLVECRRRVEPLRMSAEFRDPAWLADDRRSATLDLLARHDIAHVCVDMPQGLPESVPPTTAVTATDAVIRLHGRSPDWTHGDKEARYRHTYSAAELAEWADRAQSLSAAAGTTYVVFNNCNGDSAHVNAAQFAALLELDGRRPGHGRPRPGAADSDDAIDTCDGDINGAVFRDGAGQEWERPTLW